MIMGKYVIVVESGSDVTPELCERYGIVRVPMHVTIGDETVEDGSIDPLEIYSRCNEFGVMPKTSGCAPADFAHVYDRIHAEQPDATILHLAYSEATTCSHQSSKIAAKGRDYVFSMDTRFVSVGQSLVAVETAKYIEAHPVPPSMRFLLLRTPSWTACCWALFLPTLPSLRRAVACLTPRSWALICSRLSPALR